MNVKIPAILIGFSILNGCSSIHYTTDLNKIRTQYASNKNQTKIEDISKQRQNSITFDTPTPYAQGIKCLSSPYITGMTQNNNETIKIKENERQQANDDANIYQQNINVIYKTGGTKIQRTTTGVDFIKVEKSIQQLSIEIAKLDFSLNQRPRNSLELLEKREKLAYQLEELKSQLEVENQNLAEATNKIKETEKTLKDLEQEKDNANNVFKVAVANIYDKTGKIFPADSTSISEMVAHSLSYNDGIKLIDTPFENNWSNSRYNALANNLKINAQMLSHNTGFAGVVFPSDMYISGALVQYDELPMAKPFGTRISANIDPLDLSTETRTINVGMILRAVNSLNALIMDNSDTVNNTTGDRASVYVQNTYFVKKIGANVFEVKSKRLYGGNVTVEVADPATYVVKEMVEAGMYELLKKTIRPNEMTDVEKSKCDTIIKDSFTTSNQTKKL